MKTKKTHTPEVMKEVLNDAQSCEMHAEDDKTLLEKNKKRSVKTHVQVQALEKFYNEHKYPTESMKTKLAKSIGLTEKQVSGWFCHRRLKDKRSMNGDNYVIGRQERSSGVVQDQGSGHRQDSCGSTKQGDDKNFDTREVESGWLTLQECSAAELKYERAGHFSEHHNMNNSSSRSSSSLHNISNHHKGDTLDVATSRYLIPKFTVDVTHVKTRPGPSGYLKVKGQLENPAISEVKRHLGKHYREDGPSLGVEFDPLPPGAFESSVQNPVDETCYAGEAVLPASSDFSKTNQHPNFGKGCEYNSRMASHNPNMYRTCFEKPQGPDNYIDKKFKQNTSLFAYYPRRNSFSEMAEVSAKYIISNQSRDDYGVRYKCGVVGKRMSSASSSCHLQPFGTCLSREQESSFNKYYALGRNSSKGETINVSCNLTMNGYESHKSLDQSSARGGMITCSFLSVSDI